MSNRRSYFGRARARTLKSCRTSEARSNLPASRHPPSTAPPSPFTPSRHNVSRSITRCAAALDIRGPPHRHPQCLFDLRSRRRREGEGFSSSVQGIRRPQPCELIRWICALQGRVDGLRSCQLPGFGWWTHREVDRPHTMLVYYHRGDSSQLALQAAIGISTTPDLSLGVEARLFMLCRSCLASR